MRRRELFPVLIGGALLTRSPTAAQQKLRRVAEFTGLAENDPEAHTRFAAFSERLRELGWMPSHNVEFIRRFGRGDAGLMSSYAAELVALEPDVILTSSTQALRTGFTSFVTPETGAKFSRRMLIRSALVMYRAFTDPEATSPASRSC